MDYLVVAGSAFLAATLLPFYSEVVVVGYLAGDSAPLGLWAAATVGNTLGAVVNWVLGGWLERFEHRRWFPVSRRDLERGRRWFARYGIWSLLLAWLPVGGDALTFVAGFMRIRLLPFLVLVGIGKGLRYGVVIVASTPVFG